MCIKTWEKYIPDLKLIVINEKNVSEYISGDIDLNSFNKLSLPQQSDVVSVAVLSKFGGVFIDADTIVTKDVTGYILDRRKSIFYSFGYPDNHEIHLAIMWCMEKNNPILVRWYETIKSKMESLPKYIKWDYIGNSIIKDILNEEKYKEHFEIIDRSSSGNIIESIFRPSVDSFKAYTEFWFGSEITSPEEIINKANAGAISLHNSWTPYDFKRKSLEDVIDSNNTLSGLLCYLLTEKSH
nr:capsular polysaccharide synthesis protein [Salmonella enterica]